MKSISLSLFFLLFLYGVTPAKAQYQSLFGQNSTEWVFEWGNLFGSAQDTAYVFGDTLLNGLSYKMITVSGFSGNIDVCLLREDTIEGKVWYRALEGQAPDYFDTTEQLLFDYSLNQGDTFPIRTVFWGQGDTFAIVDSVYYDNQSRKCLVFTAMPMYLSVSGNEYFRMIEGVGSNYGILFRHLSTNYLLGQYLLCYHRDGVQTYLNNFYNTCLVHDGSPTIKTEAPNIQLFPNPIQDFLYIENPTAIDITQIKVYNNLGQKVMELPFSATLDFSQLPKGIYFIQLLNKQGIIFMKPFVKL
jgi:hypothetical protein